ncbi:hypothetical protein TSAR_008553 [Trichomalopsis sarcophagae]|uniref:Uncharacterized protein n=1 Tax=Trichomalopsis sarcophagae TaxID=543379 RepID=A0A232EFM2_9HYME|nr:hypothetical protein TSAR_008553 [Trichomalopsis sarcophagae]
MKKLKCVNEARFVLFSKTYKCSSTVNDSFKIKVKNVDGSSMPPSQSELLAAYIANIWRNAHTKVITELSLIDHGWKIVEGKYEFDWFQGDQVPQLVNNVVLQPPEENSGMQIIVGKILDQKLNWKQPTLKFPIPRRYDTFDSAPESPVLRFA